MNFLSLTSQQRGLVYLVGLALCAAGIALFFPGIRPHSTAAVRAIDLGDVRVLLPTFLEPMSEGPLDLNTATAAELDALPSIGPVLAARILAWRDAHGPFQAVDDLRNVTGIGEKVLEGIRGRVTVRSPAPNERPEP